jgi:hypothetical protein
MTLRPGEMTGRAIAVFPFLKTRDPITLGNFVFNSTDDTNDLNPEEARDRYWQEKDLVKPTNLGSFLRFGGDQFLQHRVKCGLFDLDLFLGRLFFHRFPCLFNH